MTYGKFNLQQYQDCLIVTDSKIAQLYNIKGDNVFLLPRGEHAKTLANVQTLCKWFLNKELTKSGKVVAVGGGSIGDTVGFACSVYKRGVGLLHVPTTLLAMVDSSIGGKTAVDVDDVKNAIGTFYQADTLVDFDFLKTLDDEQFTNGYGEIVKYCMLDDNVAQVFAQGDITQTVRACISFKQSICQVDPLDQNVRRQLNFGHTIGHALELVLDIPHGLAVLNGIYFETLLAQKLGLCSQEYCQKWQGVVQNLIEVLPCLTGGTLDLTLQDKKNQKDKVCFVLPNNFQQVFLPIEQVKQLLLD